MVVVFAMLRVVDTGVVPAVALAEVIFFIAVVVFADFVDAVSDD